MDIDTLEEFEKISNGGAKPAGTSAAAPSTPAVTPSSGVPGRVIVNNQNIAMTPVTFAAGTKPTQLTTESIKEISAQVDAALIAAGAPGSANQTLKLEQIQTELRN